MDKKTGYIIAGAVVVGGVLLLLTSGSTPPPPGEIGIIFRSSPDGADVYVGGYLLGKTPQTLGMGIGSYTARFHLAGYEDAIVPFTLDGSYSSGTIGVILVPIPPPSTPRLTLAIYSVGEFIIYGFGYPHIIGRISNNSSQEIANRDVQVHRRYIIPLSGNAHEQVNSMAYPLTVYNVPQSAAYPPFTLAPGQGVDFDFISALDLPHDVTNDVWIQDAVTGEKSDVFQV